MVVSCQKLCYFPHSVGSGGGWIRLSARIISLLGRIHRNQQWGSKWPVIKVGRDDCYEAQLNGAGLTEKTTT